MRSHKIHFAWFLLLWCTVSCQTEGTTASTASTSFTEEASSVQPEESSAAGGATTLKFQRQAIRDTEGFGYDVFSILVPEGWQFSGGVHWESVQGIPKGTFSYRISSPDGSAVVEGYPEQSFQWTSDPMLSSAYQQSGMTILEPVDSDQFIQQVYLPSRRPQPASLRLVQYQPQPELAATWNRLQQYLILRVYQPISPLPFVPQFSADAGVTDMEYDEGGDHWFESCLVVITGSTFNLPGMYGMSLNRPWTAQLTSFRTTRGQETGQKSLFAIMMSSARTNPRWAVDATRLIATVTRNRLQAQQAIFNQMQQIARTQSEVSDMIVSSYESRDRVMDRVFQNYSEAVRGVDSYADPINEMRVELPTGYDNAWTNGSEYVFSDSPSFNPNIQASGDWVQMNRIQH